MGRKHSLIFLPLLVLFFIIINVLTLWGYWRELETIVRRRMDHLNWAVPTTIYSRPLMIHNGQNLEAIHFIQRIRRLGYQESTSTKKLAPGSFSRSANQITLHTQPALLPEGFRESTQITIGFHPKTHVVTSIRAGADGKLLPTFDLEPEILSYLFSDKVEKRQIINLDQISPLFWNTVIVMEDIRFRDHTGVDVKGILRALYHDIRQGSLSQGGSTLTQQLVKNFFLNRQRKIARKINEALMSIILERAYSKEKILEAYLNEIYFGQDGSYPIHGIQEASLFYFAKQAKDLTAAESALLVALIRGPGVYSPFLQPENSLQRRNLVLGKMLETELISKTDYDEALAQPIPKEARSRYQKRIAPFYVDDVISELIQILETRSISGEGLSVFTSLDPLLQSIAAPAFRKSVAALEKDVPIEGAFVLIDHRSGDLLALSGGRDYGRSQFNRATQARRQIGSLFKPIVYLKALIDTYEGKRSYHWHSLLEDSPFEWVYDSQSWAPKNYDEAFRGPITLTDALVTSSNVATARLGQELGLAGIIQLGISLGFSGPIPEVPSVLLGSSVSTPMEVATVFGGIANSCIQYQPVITTVVYDSSRNRLWQHEPTPDVRAPSAPCALLRLMMRETFQTGTARGFRKKSWAHEFAAKTGTTSNLRDSWFVGFDSQWTLLTWIGNDAEAATGLTGATGALPVWTSIVDALDSVRPQLGDIPLNEELSSGRVPIIGSPPASKPCQKTMPIYYFRDQPPVDLCP